MVKNDPTVKWYQNKLIKAGITASHWSVRHQLNRLAKFGIVDKSKRTRRVTTKSERLPGLIRREVCDYRLNEAITRHCSRH